MGNQYLGSRNCRAVGVYWNNGNELSGIFSRHGRTSERFAEVVVVPLVGWRPGRRARLLTSFFLKSIFYRSRCHIDTRETHIVT